MDYSAFLARSGRSRDALPYSQEAYALAQRVENPYLLGLAAGVMSMAVPAERQRFAQQAISLLRQGSQGRRWPARCGCGETSCGRRARWMRRGLLMRRVFNYCVRWAM